jgi:predicted lipoprotein with Yx(FWY)xxD motif
VHSNTENRLSPARGMLALLLIMFGLTGTASGQPQEEAVNAGTTVQILLDQNGKSYLAGPDGMTLYTLSKDEQGTSNCVRGCIENWPPLTTERQTVEPAGLTGSLGTFIRKPPDNRTQVTYENLPLYYWSRDQVPGDMTGEGIGDIWTVARPVGASR